MVARFSPELKTRFSRNELGEIRSYLERYTEVKHLELEKLSKMKRLPDEKIIQKKNRYEKAQQRLLQLLTKLNEPSLIEELNAILNKYKLTLTNKERSLFKKARQTRNSIIHGKKIQQVTKEEYNIVSKIIYLVIKHSILNRHS